MSTRVTAAAARPARTAIQGVPAFVITEGVDAFLYDMSDKQYAALAGLLLLLFSWGQALTENRLGRGFLRQVPPRTEPVLDEA